MTGKRWGIALWMFLLLAGIGSGDPNSLFAKNVPGFEDYARGALAYDSGDYKRAMRSYLKGAALGNPDAQKKVGDMYRLGLPEDAGAALKRLRP